MSNFGYGGDGYTSTTNHGAQGGADGGGFMGGSQQGSQESPGGSRTYGKETLRPVTIKQIIDAQQPHPDSDHKIDNSDVTQITFVGQVHTVASQITNITYKLDDGTGLIEVKQWLDAEQEPQVQPAAEGSYLRVYGRIKSFNGKKHVGAHVVRPVTDFNEVNYHLLEATAVHLYFTRGPPGDPSAAGVKTESGTGGMFVDSGMNGGGAAAVISGKKLPVKLTQTARKVFQLLQSAPQNNEGLHVQNIASQCGVGVNDVFKAGDELLGEGLIYTTVDDETWAVLEY